VLTQNIRDRWCCLFVCSISKTTRQI